MAEGHVGYKYSPEIASTFEVERKLLSVNNNSNFNDSDVVVEDIQFIQDVSGECAAYYSDSENSSSGRTDLSMSFRGSLSPEPFCENDLSHKLGVEVTDIAEDGSVPLLINSRIEEGLETASFLVTNLAPVVEQLKQWRRELPMVEPFYAVKCNPDPVIVKLLASLGCNFDCATMGEIDLVLHGLGELSFAARGLASTSIVYANPAKMEHMLDFAVQHNVRMTVFDGEDELHKIAGIQGHESLQLLLRLTTDDKASICRFSKKFGCPVDEAPRLLDVAKSLGLNVTGVSFHVGSGCGDSDAYTTALLHARRVFEEAALRGMAPMTVVDLGGGFPGDAGGYGGPGMPTFQDLAVAIRAGIAAFKHGFAGRAETVRFIAEPGRYFVSASTTIATKIYSRKGGNNAYQALYVDDGVYGSFNNVVYDHATPVPRQLSSAVAADRLAAVPKAPAGGSPTSVAKSVSSSSLKEAGAGGAELIPSAVFGPTCDGLDQMCSLEGTLLPRCQVGEWLIWENQGAYTHTASFVFNGYTHLPKKSYCFHAGVAGK